MCQLSWLLSQIDPFQTATIDHAIDQGRLGSVQDFISTPQRPEGEQNLGGRPTLLGPDCNRQEGGRPKFVERNCSRYYY